MTIQGQDCCTFSPQCSQLSAVVSSNPQLLKINSRKYNFLLAQACLMPNAMLPCYYYIISLKYGVAGPGFRFNCLRVCTGYAVRHVVSSDGVTLGGVTIILKIGSLMEAEIPCSVSLFLDGRPF
ncbi:hypothetical protein POTOM_013847 [Populus tomentosa]|uniref:Uncharacterized protein n=1 Tax=Populus tomentosa TaxID=118781 RepID=A0A8X8D7X6_POPTO|nr:hypothetical protein POTOM_013847 [Populus tomentosa]